MFPTADTLVILAAIAAAWLSIRQGQRDIIAEIRRVEGLANEDDLQWQRAQDAVADILKQPISPRELLENRLRSSHEPAA